MWFMAQMQHNSYSIADYIIIFQSEDDRGTAGESNLKVSFLNRLQMAVWKHFINYLVAMLTDATILSIRNKATEGCWEKIHKDV